MNMKKNQSESIKSKVIFCIMQQEWQNEFFKTLKCIIQFCSVDESLEPIYFFTATSSIINLCLCTIYYYNNPITKSGIKPNVMVSRTVITNNNLWLKLSSIADSLLLCLKYIAIMILK
jgi:hypothetical protein